MWQVLRTYVLLAAWAAVTGSFAPPAVEAQTTTSKGYGEHLLFAYWSAEAGTSTNVAVYRHLGVRGTASEEKPLVAQLAVRDPMGKIATEFKICLMPGDSWTATLTGAGLRVGSPGECDERIHQGGGTRTGKLVVTPKQGEVVALGAATSGWLDVWQTPANALKDGPDEDTEPDHARRRPDYWRIGGEATLVSPGAGFASSYRAVSLRGCGDWINTTASASTDENDYLNALVRAVYPHHTGTTEGDVDTGDGCWTIDKNGDNVVDRKLPDDPYGYDEFEPIEEALTNQGTNIEKNLLMGRWTALNDEHVQTHTKVVITFPQRPLRYEGKNTEGAEVKGTDPLSILVFDEAGEVALDSRKVEIGRNVNVCTFRPVGMEAAPDMEAAPAAGLSCNGERVGALNGATSGSFRLFNQKAMQMNAAGTVTNDGTEATGFGIKRSVAGDANYPAVAGGGQAPDAWYRFPTVGLVFSYFRGHGWRAVRPSRAVEWAASGCAGGCGRDG